MYKRPIYFVGLFLYLIPLLLQSIFLPVVTQSGAGGGATNGTQQATAKQPGDLWFIQRADGELQMHGRTFRFGGSNNYYLMYKSKAMVDDVLETAAANGFSVLRMWGSLDIGNQDGSNSIHGKADGVYFQYWDGAAPAYNDGEDGLQHLDYVLYKARQQRIHLVIPLINNWSAFGGMDQYVRWFGGQYHDQFYSEVTIRAWFKNWIAHLLNRINTYTGVAYKDDPTIMTWELANEPRCIGSGAYPRSAACNTQTLLAWADDISTFIKSIDKKHLVSAGDEGFYCIPGTTDWTENCNEGVDTVALASLPNMDVLSYHLYPDHWGKSAAWGTQWITRHIQEARLIGKPAMLGEFGWQDKSTRNPVFKEWTDTVNQNGGAGALYWILSGKQDDGSYYSDYDGFTVYCPSPVCITLRNFALVMKSVFNLTFPPVADSDTVIAEFNTPATLAPTANDIAYAPAVLVPGSIDLDPAIAGQQTTFTAVGGLFELQSDGQVLFTPTLDFVGKAVASYTILDSWNRLSNPADLAVIVKPNPSAPIVLFSFETGTEGWAAASWNDAGPVSQSADYHTDGSFSLRVDSTNGGWFGVIFSTPLDISTKTHMKFDVKTTGAGTSTSVALQLGDSWSWCQTGWGWINSGTTATVDVDMLTGLGCSSPELNKVQAIYFWFSGGGTFYLDFIRAE